MSSRRLVYANAVFLNVLLAWMSALPCSAAEGKRIVFLAGRPSHDYGSHEHLAGCRILADAIGRSAPGTKCDVYSGGWPEKDELLEGADTIIMYCDGGKGHPALQHLPAIKKQMDRGVGFVCLHYGVEVPKEDAGEQFLDWLGGYFEMNWSVNPHWVAEYKSLPDHPITRGVKPFSANDEWYFHMRFRPEMKGVTPILSAVPPPGTMSRANGTHSGNPAVREEVAKGLQQHMAWAYERDNGGRSFGFTGGHFHWNWGRPEIITLVCNAICWTAKMEIPPGGLGVKQPAADSLKDGQDEMPPPKFDFEKIKADFKLTSVGTADTKTAEAGNSAGAKPRLIYSSPIVNTRFKDHKLDAEVNLTGVSKLFLVVTDAGDGFSCDWADWLEPTLIKGTTQKDLTELNWKRAEAEWGTVQKNKNVEGAPLVVGGKTFAKGIGTHANSVISFDLDGTWEKLRVGCGIDAGGANQNNGSTSSVKFAVYADAAPTSFGEARTGGNQQHEADNAVAGLDIHPDLQATLAASEPKLLSLTNLDVDHRGRVWVCEVVNYRRHNGERSDGDRILILEDTNQDGVMDKETVYFQGREVDSAMGICVLGNRVIVSASPNVWIFTDENGDDKPDRKELFFTKTGDPQHDHSAHSFLFGPDGKLYWNFGNTGKNVHDAKGNIVHDIAGNEVRDSGKPYRQGMPFRCNLDGSQFEVLGYNFRNNYEVTVDSFGALWQSDNDDDGNRATRVNFVMEHGNFGYVDEVTGEAWRVERTNMENDIPLQHWHLNDPGVVPTMLITGAGSPTGITVYEGDLLPQVFRNQVIHCDAGPNVVRAYPASPEGAGYKADIVNMMVGERDRWFRPADVCTAPDGSLFVTDWYDPGVGGHNMQDMERGRLFRLAPPNTKYVVPKFDFSSPAGAVAALANPASSVRYLAWEAIQKFGNTAMPALAKMSSDSNPRMRARAIWAIGKLASHGEEAVRMAIKDQDPNVRMVAIRLARQLELPATSYAELVRDPSAAVRREFAVALHLDKSSDMPKHWAELALQYDGQDRWYLEALGIGASLRWTECFDAYSAKASFDTPAARDIAWRARCPKAAQMLTEFITSPEVDDKDVAKYIRGLDFQAPADRDGAIKNLLAAKSNSQLKQSRQDMVLVECLSRAGADVKLSSEQQEAVTRYLKESTNRAQQLKIIRQLKLPTTVDLLVDMVVSADPDSQSVAAVEMLLRRGNTSGKLAGILTDKNRVAEAQRMSMAIGMSKLETSGKFIDEVFEHDDMPGEVKAELAKGLAQNDAGGRWLLERAKNGKLPNSARLIVGSRLRASNNAEIRKAATELFPAPKSAAKEPLPPISELVARKGNAEKGLQVFKLKGTCANCHIVSNQGKNVGPDLTEIGSKLSREAMLVSILDPSAGISHNYENYAALTEDGTSINGLLVSKTDAQVVLKDAQGIERTIASDDLAQFKKLEKSLMPENLHEALTTDELVDLMEYLMTLRKK